MDRVPELAAAPARDEMVAALMTFKSRPPAGQAATVSTSAAANIAAASEGSIDKNEAKMDGESAATYA
jgi:hypothetical protein